MNSKNNKNMFSKTKTARVSAKAWLTSTIMHILLITSLFFFGLFHLPKHDSGTGESNVKVLNTITESTPSTSADSGYQNQNMEFTTQPLKVELAQSKINDIEQNFKSDSSQQILNSKLETQIVSSQNNQQQGFENIGKQNWDNYIDFAGSGTKDSAGASFFGISDGGRKFAYVVDCSGSMKGEPIEAAKSELLRSIKSLRKSCSYSVIFYNSKHHMLDQDKLVKASKRNFRKYTSWINGITVDGSTNPLPAIKKAISMNPDCIWILSDGVFQSEVKNEIRNLNSNQNIHIHTIGFINENGSDLLRKIAEENNGKFRFVRMSPNKTHRSK